MGKSNLCVLAFFVVSAAGAQSIDYRCPVTYTGDDGRALPLLERPSGVWRVDAPVPFVTGLGRFWRLVCAYRDPELPSGEMEAVVHWVSQPHEDGRLILEDVCHDAAAAAGVLRSAERQAKARASAPQSSANLRLAREMLSAAEGRAFPCPGAPESPWICPRWEVSENYQSDRRRVCTWRQGLAPEPDPEDAFRYVYRSECRFRGFVTRGTVRRTGPGVFERSNRDGEGRLIRRVYRGEFEKGGVVEGFFRWFSPDGDRSLGTSFTARCIERDVVE